MQLTIPGSKTLVVGMHATVEHARVNCENAHVQILHNHHMLGKMVLVVAVSHFTKPGCASWLHVSSAHSIGPSLVPYETL